MKSLSGTIKFLTGAALGMAAVVVFAQGSQGKKDVDPTKHGIRLIMGHKSNEPLHVTEASLKAALNKCDKKAYKIRFSKKKEAVDWEDGNLGDITVSEVTAIRPDTGGATPGPVQGLSASGVHSTQQVAFSNAVELKAFVNELEPASTP